MTGVIKLGDGEVLKCAKPHSKRCGCALRGSLFGILVICITGHDYFG